MTMRSRMIDSLACAVALAMAAWWGFHATASAAEGAVTIKLFQYQPGTLTVRAGTRVVWINGDEIQHTVTAGTPEQRGGRFAAKLDGKGASTSVTFDEAGVYPYFCERHQHMRGEIRVNLRSTQRGDEP